MRRASLLLCGVFSALALGWLGSPASAQVLTDVSAVDKDGATIVELRVDAEFGRVDSRDVNSDGAFATVLLPGLSTTRPGTHLVGAAKVRAVRIEEMTGRDGIAAVFELISDRVGITRLEQRADCLLVEIQECSSGDPAEGDDARPRASIPDPALTAVATELRADGSTIVTIRTDRSVEPFSVRELYLAGIDARHVISLSGVTAAEMPSRKSVQDGNLRAIQIMARSRPDSTLVHVVLELASPRIEVAAIVQEGPTLLVRLQPRSDSED